MNKMNIEAMEKVNGGVWWSANAPDKLAVPPKMAEPDKLALPFSLAGSAIYRKRPERPSIGLELEGNLAARPGIVLEAPDLADGILE